MRCGKYNKGAMEVGDTKDYAFSTMKGNKWVTVVYDVHRDEDFGYMYRLARKNGKVHIGARPVKDGLLIMLNGVEILLRPVPPPLVI